MGRNSPISVVALCAVSSTGTSTTRVAFLPSGRAAAHGGGSCRHLAVRLTAIMVSEDTPQAQVCSQVSASQVTAKAHLCLARQPSGQGRAAVNLAATSTKRKSGKSTRRTLLKQALTSRSSFFLAWTTSLMSSGGEGTTARILDRRHRPEWRISGILLLRCSLWWRRLACPRLTVCNQGMVVPPQWLHRTSERLQISAACTAWVQPREPLRAR